MKMKTNFTVDSNIRLVRPITVYGSSLSNSENDLFVFAVYSYRAGKKILMGTHFEGAHHPNL